MSETTERLDAIEARLNAATPGPWETSMSNEDYPPVTYTVITGSHGDVVAELADDVRSELREGPQASASADSWFIANAPTDIADLLTLARKQAAALERVEALAKSALPTQGLGGMYSGIVLSDHILAALEPKS